MNTDGLLGDICPVICVAAETPVRQFIGVLRGSNVGSWAADLWLDSIPDRAIISGDVIHAPGTS
jgi:hypothetical protein